MGKWDVLEVIKAKPDHLVHTPHIGQLTDEEVQTIVDADIPMVSSLGTLGIFTMKTTSRYFVMATLTAGTRYRASARVR